MREKITNILEFELIKVGDFVITPFEILSVLILFFVLRLAIIIVRRFFKREVKKGRFDEGRASSISKIIIYFLWVVSIAYALDIVGIKITFLLAGSAALLVGVGLGLQQTFNDFISGIILLFEGSVKEGDVIELEDKTVGRVREINMRVSLISTRDEISILIPNSKLVNDSVINWSHNTRLTRFAVQVGVAYGSDVELVKELLVEATKDVPKVSERKKPVARFKGFGDSALDFDLLFYSDLTFEVEFIKSDIRTNIDRLFRENGIVIPFPQRDLHIKSGKL